MMRPALALTLALAAALASAQTAPADSGSPIFVQPPQQQTPAPNITAPSVTVPAITAPQPVLTSEALPAAPARDRFTVWGGLSTEYFLFPGVMVGASVPVGRLGSVDLNLRGSAEVILLPLNDVAAPAPFVNVDLLLSGAGRKPRFYGGPSVGAVPGFALILGGVAGVRSDFGNGPWGYFAEGKLRFLYGATLRGGTYDVLPGVNLGITYRF